MIKVPARNKFARKTSYLIKPDDNVITKRKQSRNRSSILMNGQNLQELLSFSLSQNIQQSDIKHHLAKASRFQESSSQRKSQRKSQTKRIASNKFSEASQQTNNQQKSFSNLKFNKLNDSFIKKINFEKSNKDKQDNNLQTKVETPLTNSIRASGIKKPLNRKYSDQKKNNSFLRKSQTKKNKISIFNNYLIGTNNASSNFEEFLKETMRDENKQNKQQVEEQPNQLKRLQKCLKKSDENTRKISHNQMIFRKPSQRFSRNIYQNISQKRLIIDIDQQITSDKKQKINVNGSGNKRHTEESQRTQRNQTQKILNDQQKQQLLKETEQKKIQLENIYKEQTQQLFRKLERQIASRQQIEFFQKRSVNFYEELRLKLTKKYDEISRSYKLDDKQKDKIGLLLEGCNLQRHRRINNFYFEKKMFSNTVRPGTAGALDQASKDINNLNFVTKQRNKTIMRPQTSRSKSTLRLKTKYLPQKSSNKLSDFMTIGNQTQRHLKDPILNKSENKFSQFGSQSVFFLTNNDISMRSLNMEDEIDKKKRFSCKQGTLMTQKQKKQLTKQSNLKIKEKFSNLLDQCDDQNYEHQETKKKMKVFEYYCGKMDNGFEKLSTRINDYLSKL